jgi:exosome complex RNA-binding protein Rrp42 (RNase PH superfamily)
VWRLDVDVHVLDHGGNLVDAACLSALAALYVFRKPETTVGGASGTEVTVHSPDVRTRHHALLWPSGGLRLPCIFPAPSVRVLHVPLCGSLQLQQQYHLSED